MKKLILSMTVVAFALAAQAGGDKCAANSEKPACCPKANAQQAKASCMVKKNAAAKTASKPLPSPKATSLASK